MYIYDTESELIILLIMYCIDLLDANEIHTFAIYGTRPCATIFDVNFVQQVLEKTIVLSFIHLTYD